MEKKTLNTVEDLENKQTVNQNEKINDSAKRVADADDETDDETDDDEEEETEYDIDEDSEELFEAVANACGCDEDEAKCIIAVARFEGDDFDTVAANYKCDGHNVESGSAEYYVYDDYNDAEEDAIDSAESTIDDLGINAINTDMQDYVLENFCDNYPWEQEMNDYHVSYAEDIANESASSDKYANRLIEECVDAGIIDDDDLDDDGEYNNGEYDGLVEDYANSMDDNFSSMSEWFEDIYGSGWTSEVADVIADYMDTRAVAEWCVETDGVAHYLAGYDGDENEEDVDGTTYYIYRWN